MARTSEWFNGLSKTAQATYLKAHPNSKFGKSGAKSSGTTSSKSTTQINAEIVKLTYAINKVKQQYRKADTASKPNLLGKMKKMQERLQKLKESRVGKKVPSASVTSKQLQKAKSDNQATTKLVNKLNNRHISILGKIQRHKAGVGGKSVNDERYKNLLASEKQVKQELKKAVESDGKASKAYKAASLNHGSATGKLKTSSKPKTKKSSTTKTARKAPATVGGGSSRMKAIAKITALSAQLKELRSKQSAVKQGSVAYKRLESEMNAIKKQRLQLKAKHM